MNYVKKIQILIEKPIVSRFNVILDDIDLNPNKLAKEVDKSIMIITIFIKLKIWKKQI